MGVSTITFGLADTVPYRRLAQKTAAITTKNLYFIPFLPILVYNHIKKIIACYILCTIHFNLELSPITKSMGFKKMKYSVLEAS
jgi:hypothetical protein